ncbi:MAG: HDIG domain-containing protein [Bacteroidales bacterium]|nr:MAG: HDIG domain-containing protein [Bacteroidales bacterium]
MKRVVEYLREKQEFIFRGLIILVSVTILVYLFPREGKFRYEYQKGKPWGHEDLIAPYDFPIYKLENELTAERDSILREFKPYFKYDTVIAINQLNEFYESFEEQWKAHLREEYGITEELNESRWAHRRLIEQEDRYKSFAVNLLEFVYSKGIVGVDDVLDRVDNIDLSIVLMRGNIAEEYDYSEVFTQKTAYEYLLNEVNSMKLEDVREGEDIAIAFFKELNLNEFIEPNLFYDEETSSTVKESLIGEISLTQGLVQTGERIISRGEVVNTQKFRILESLRKEYESRMGYSSNYFLVLTGQMILIFVSILVLFLFLFHFRNEIYQDNVKTMFVVFLLVLFVFISRMILKTQVISVYLIPFAIVPIIVRTFYDARLGLFIHMLTLLVIGFLVANAFEFVFLNIITGIVALFSLTNIYRRGKLFLTAVLVFISYGIVYSGMAILQEGNLSSIEWLNYAWFAGNSGLILLSYPLIYVFEKTFGFLSDATLVELSDTNQPLLRELAEKAPGSFQHSLQVSNLAEEAVRVIGGNPLLIRTGALYHDIGKMDKPIYFIENQRNGYNPHDSLEFEESAEIIIDHVAKGVEMAKKHSLPGQIIDFIRTHHGTTMVQYFYRSYIKKFPQEEVDIKRFTYPGPKPFSKETATLMMADSVEAASRSLNSFSQESIDELVENIIDRQVRESQFYDSPITFRDIDTIKEIFKRRLANIYHVRIAYPEEAGK